jgi:hypothetical protein
VSLDFDAAPYIPILGGVACAMGQVTPAQFTRDPGVQAAALAAVAASLRSDAVTVGWRSTVEVGVAVVSRLPGRETVALLAAVDAGAARDYCEAGVAAILMFEPAEAREIKYRQVARAAGHYEVPVILVDPGRGDAPAFAASVGLAGAVVAAVSGLEPGIVGGGLRPDGTSEHDGPPRAWRFFWTFPGEVPEALAPEALTALGGRLA